MEEIWPNSKVSKISRSRGDKIRRGPREKGGELKIKKRRFFAATTKPWQRRIVATKEDRYSATNFERIALIRGEVGFVLSGRRGRKMEVTGQ